MDGWAWGIIFFVAFVFVLFIIIIIIVGLEQEGVDKPCTTNEQCGGGADFLCVGGKCKKKDGQSCIDSAECASGSCIDFVCATGGTGIFILGCTGPVGTQGSCPANDLCAADRKCLGDLFTPCKSKTDCFYQPSVCTGLGPSANPVCLSGQGGVCTGGTGCAPGLTCSTTTGTGTCKVSNSATTSLGAGVTPLPAMGMGLAAPAQIQMGLATPRTTTFRPTQMTMRSDCVSTPRTNTTFYVESMPTRAERIDNYCTPPSGDVENPFKKIRKDMVMSREDTKQSPVIDVTSYSNATLALMKDGKIIRETRDKKREIVANNIRLKRLESFNGTLYAISVDGRVFQLNNDSFETRKWYWTLAPLPTNVIHTSATLNGKHFWVQTDETGLLYDRQFRVVDRASTRNRKRIYGNDKNIYIDIDTQNNTGVLQPNGTRVNDVAGAIITHDNQLKVLRSNQTNLFSDIRLINWIPTYILKAL